MGIGKFGAVIACSITLILIINIVMAQTDPWLSGYNYRKSHVINGATGAGTGYQVCIKVYSGSGTDGTETVNGMTCGKVYLSGHSLNWPNDIRFTDNDETSLLDHWKETSDGSSALFWVKVTDDLSTSRTIYIYYGKAGESSASDGENTFIFFDDFDSFDTDKWTATGSYSVASSQITITTGSVYSDNTVASQPGVMSEAKVKWNNFAGYSGLEIADVQATVGSNGNSDKLVYLMTDSGGSSDVRAWAADGTTASYNIVGGNWQFGAVAGTTYVLGHTVNSSRVTFYRDRTDTDSFSGTWSAPFYLWLGYFTGSNAGSINIADIVVDWVLVRKYLSAGPSHGSWGNEESPAAVFKYLSFSASINQIDINWFTESEEDVVNVECDINGIQNCQPFPYSSAPGGGSCTILSPNYDMSLDPDGELRTVQNTIHCKAYNQGAPESYSETTRGFFPLSFEVNMPSSMSSTVGEEKDFVITIKNNGTLSDSYDINVVSISPEILVIGDGSQTTETLYTNDVQQIYVKFNILSTQSTNADISVSSETSQSYTDISLDQTVNVKGGVVSLPDFGILGIIQIILFSSLILVSFLF